MTASKAAPVVGRKVKVSLDPLEYLNPPEPLVGRVEGVFRYLEGPDYFLVNLDQETKVEIVSPLRFRERIEARERGERDIRPRITSRDFVAVRTRYLAVYFRIPSARVSEALEGRLPQREGAPAVIVYPHNLSAIRKGEVQPSDLVSVGPGWMVFLDHGAKA
jgi:hypothetical protein